MLSTQAKWRAPAQHILLARETERKMAACHECRNGFLCLVGIGANKMLQKLFSREKDGPAKGP
jgi:hypothetical protein